jgi:DNA polymerase III sliding clamp (beta) subunit (PCNA family)
MNKTQREAVKLLRAVAPRKATIPILTHALLDAGGARVTDLGGVEARASAEALHLTGERGEAVIMPMRI